MKTPQEISAQVYTIAATLSGNIPVEAQREITHPDVFHLWMGFVFLRAHLRDFSDIENPDTSEKTRQELHQKLDHVWACYKHLVQLSQKERAEKVSAMAESISKPNVH